MEIDRNSVTPTSQSGDGDYSESHVLTAPFVQALLPYCLTTVFSEITVHVSYLLAYAWQLSCGCDPLAHATFRKKMRRVLATLQPTLTQQLCLSDLVMGLAQHVCFANSQAWSTFPAARTEEGDLAPHGLRIQLKKSQSNKVIFGAPEARITAPL